MRPGLSEPSPPTYIRQKLGIFRGTLPFRIQTLARAQRACALFRVQSPIGDCSKRVFTWAIGDARRAEAPGLRDALLARGRDTARSVSALRTTCRKQTRYQSSISSRRKTRLGIGGKSKSGSPPGRGRRKKATIPSMTPFPIILRVRATWA